MSIQINPKLKQELEDNLKFIESIHKAKASPGFTVLGEFDELPRYAKVGDIVTIRDNVYCYSYYKDGHCEWIQIGLPPLESVPKHFYGTKNLWDTLGEDKYLYETIYIIDEPASRIQYPTNCKNCGAVLNGEKCEYCGTNYYR